MPYGICKGCGRATNSTLSNWWDTDTKDHATECYAAWEEGIAGLSGKWVKGCAYDKLDRSDKNSPIHFADKIISK